ncbi:UHRF1-binding protein 1-like isoform X2 [Dreissena polymorpha]|nr:UHRF1-binding protein 1-like isoform X2 [Dreissena polymorpha]
MGSLLKNTILKHLSKFAKNLSPDKINISTLKGEGELSNLELNETILMDLLDLPTWMRLRKAFCNKVSIKIQWTKLKSQPIRLFLDEVVLEIETCSEPREPNSASQFANQRSEGRYGFVDKVIDGIYVHINSVTVQFNSLKFHANLQLSRLKVESLTPNWQVPTDIRQTRIRSESTDEILLFKEVDWQTTRIEANAREDETSLPSTPLRLIANQSKIRIVLKKKLSDCSLMSSRVIFLLDDLLWVLTDTQLKAAILYANSLRSIIEKSGEQSKRLAAQKLQKQTSSSADQLLLQQQQQQQRQRSETNEAKLFQRYDVLTTSYHLITSRVDLHLCDDTPLDKESSPKHNKSINGGAMQVVFHRLSIDYYPFHYAGGERKNWYRYSDNQGSRNSWVQDLFTQFREEAKKARETCKVVSPSQSPAHTLKSPSHQPRSLSNPAANQNQSTRSGRPPPAQVQGHSTLSASRPKVTKLLESCMVLKIEDFIIYMVSTVNNKKGTRGSSPQKFLSSDKKVLHLPADMSMVHIEYTDYFFTEGIDYPVPHANLYILVNPVRLHVDFLTILWANYFSLNLLQSVESQQGDLERQLEHVDVKLEALMPRLVVSSEEKVSNQPDRPESLQIQLSKLTASNTHSESGFTLDNLKTILDSYADCDMFHSGDFPNNHDNKLTSIPQIFYDFANSRVNPFLCEYAFDLVRGQLPDGLNGMDSLEESIKVLLKTNTLKRDMRCDIWTVSVDQVWLEFLGVPTSRTRPVPFVESFPLTLWLCQPSQIPEGVVLPKHKWAKPVQVTSEPAVERESRRSRKLLKQYYSDSGEDSSTTDSTSEAGISRSQSLSSCDNLSENVQYTSLQVADFNLVAKIGSKIRAQLSQPQYLFLMRLADSLTNFQLELNADMEDCSKNSSQSAAKTFSIPLVIPDLEFAMVCPYIAELLPLSNSADLLNSPTEACIQGSEVYHVEMEPSGEGMGYNQGYPETHGEIYERALQDQYLQVKYNEQDMAPQVEISSYPIDSCIPHSLSDSTIMLHSQTGDSLHNLSGVPKDAHSSEDLVKNLDSTPHNISQLAVSDSGLSSLGSSQQGQRSRSNSKLTPTSVKNSLSSGVSNISNFMGKIKNKLDPDEIDDDSISIKTDTSDDDFDFVSVEEIEAPAFNHSRVSETASSTDTDDRSSVFAESTSASKAKELVSVVVFRLSGSEISIQTEGEDMFFCLQTRAIDCEETGNIVYEDFYNKLSSNGGIIRIPASTQPRVYPIKFKMTMGPTAGKLVPKGAELGLMEVSARDTGFTFRMSSLLNMGAFAQDEKVSTPIPMQITVKNFNLTLVEDRPPPVNVVKPPEVPPVQVNIQDMFILRLDDGEFRISTGISESLFSKETISSIIPNGLESLTRNKTPAPDISANQDSDTSEKLRKLQNENAQMKILLTKLDNHTQMQDRQIEDLEKANKVNEEIKLKNKEFTSKLLNEYEDSRRARNELENDNAQLCEKVVNLEEEVHNLTLEKNSLLSTLQLMQDELLVSEQQRKPSGSPRTHSYQ